MPVSPTPVDTAPTVPDRSDRATYPLRMFSFFTWMANSLVSGINALGSGTYDNAVEAVDAATAAVDAAAAAEAAAVASGAIKWISGTYAIGDARWSPIDYQTYRRTTDGAGTTDPSADASNWTRVYYAPADASQAEAEAGAGTSNRSWAPLRIAQAIAALGTGHKVAPYGGGTLTGKNSMHIIMSSGAYTLPDLTGATSFVVGASGSAQTVPASLTTSDGWSITTGFSAGTSKLLTPIACHAPHGSWLDTMTPPTLGTITGSAAPTLLGSVQLDTDLVAVLYHNGTNVYAAAIKPSTGACTASPASLGTYTDTSGYEAIFADSTTTFVAFANLEGTSTRSSMIAGSVNTSTLAITLGTKATIANSQLVDTPVKLQAGSYFVAVGSGTTDIYAPSVSGTTCTPGAGAASGAVAGGVGCIKIARSTNTQALIGYLSTGGGTNSTRAFAVRCVNVSGTTPNPQAASTGTNIENNAGLRALVPYAEGSSYLAVVQNGSVTTTGDYYGITVSVNTATRGNVSQQVNSLPADFKAKTYIYKPAAAIIKYDSTTLLFGHLAAGPFAVTISGTTPTVGASGGPAAVTNFLVDATAGTTFYAVQSGKFDKLGVSGTTVTSSWQVAIQPTVIVSDTLTDKAASYSGTWYSWTLPTVATPITATKWLFASGNNYIYGGPVS